MRTETIKRKLYKFEELSEEAQEEAIERLYDINVDYEWWNFTYDDAERIGLKITAFDIDRGNYIKGKVTEDTRTMAELILKDHGSITDTYKLAHEYLEQLYIWQSYDQEVDDYGYEEDIPEDIEEEFIRQLKEEYLSILRKEYEYLTSREAIIETIEANEYEFTVDGKLR